MSAAAKPEFSRLLLTWYRRQGRSLPWRKNKEPWRVWVSEIMLQQTTVDTVIPYYEKFLRQFPSPKKLAAATETEAVKAWEGLGYYRRVRHLRKAAAVVAREGFPTSMIAWRELPGIGPYTSAMLASILHEEPEAALDGNLLRVGARLFNIHLNVDTPVGRQKIRTLLQQTFFSRDPGSVNQALMDLGASICRPGRPLCQECPLRKVCKGSGKAHTLPIRKKRPVTLPLKVAVALIQRKDGKFLLDLRSDKVVMGGLWEFPGGKIEEGESPEEGLMREIKEETGLTLRLVRKLPTVNHAYTRFRVKLFPYLCTVKSGRARPKDKAVAQLRWFLPAEFPKLAMPAGSRKILRRISPEFLVRAQP